MSELAPLAVISQAWDLNRDPDLVGVFHAVINDGSLSLSNVGSGDRSPRVIDLPTKPFTMASTEGPSHEAWLSLLAWLRGVVGHRAHFVVDYDHPLRELILLGAAAYGIRYSLLFTAAPGRFSSPLEYALLSNAETMLFPEADVQDEFHRNYFAPYTALESISELLESLPSRPTSAVVDDRNGANASARSGPDTDEPPVRVLLVAYFSGPCRTVGVQRPNYWFDELGNVSGGAIEAHIVSTTPWGEDRENVHVVPDFHVASLLNDDNSYPSWSADFVDAELQDAKSFNTLSFYWRYALEKYFNDLDCHFDVVIISGNPFSCFEFAAYARSRWSARVILDYRDPFGNNPRFQYSPEARQATRYAERGFNLQADIVLVVNEFCVDLVEPGNIDAEIVNIPNGYDERILGSVEPIALTSGRINFVHAGSFTHDRSPAHILRALDPRRHAFHHVGNIAGVDPALMDHESVIAHGRLPYTEALRIVGGADIGVVFLSEENFETTTKLFDYLAMGIDILLCTNGEIGVGAVADVLDGYDGVYWCKNTRDDAARFVKDYLPSAGHDRSESAMFSRRHGTELLAARIIDLAKNQARG